MKISVHQLVVFKKIVEKSGITAAAKALHMTQPAVSNILKALENYYGCKLIELIGKKVFITPSGQKLYDSATQIQETLVNTETEIKNINGQISGKLKVSAVSTAKYFIPRLLGAFKKNHTENFDIELKVCNRKEIIERLNENLDDFVIMSQPPKDKGLLIKDFFEDQLVVAVSSKSDLLKKQNWCLDELASQNWVIREEGSGTRIVMQKLFDENEIKPNIVMEVGNNESIKQIIMADMGISIVSMQSIEFELDLGLIETLSVKGFPLFHEWYWVAHKPKVQSLLMTEFLAFAHTHSNDAHYYNWQK
ncbi:LysR family transcriptional regulator [Cysteiniphilum sp. 19S12-1]|uniref:LysR family transcriptional regulator n=1 Tax=Cysteiniphilum sp. 19S12-1 TaxID=3453130 RepID=UPI003F84D3D8